MTFTSRARDTFAFCSCVQYDILHSSDNKTNHNDSDPLFHQDLDHSDNFISPTTFLFIQVKMCLNDSTRKAWPRSTDKHCIDIFWGQDCHMNENLHIH